MGLAVCLVAAGCGSDTRPGGSAEDAPTVKPASPAERVTFSNRPGNIDGTPTNHPTLQAFERETGTHVEYRPEVANPVLFLQGIRRELDEGQSGGRDLIVLPGLQAGNLAARGAIQRFDSAALPNANRNLLPELRDPLYDPGRRFTMPYQAGMTGLLVRKDLAPGVDEIEDAFDPKYRGRVTVLRNTWDTVPMTLLSMGKAPETASVDDFEDAIEKLRDANDSGQIRRFTGSDYGRDLLRGQAWISLGYSGDAIELERRNPNIEFVAPKEGIMLWTNDMVIPVGAPAPFTAEQLIDFYYRPEIQAMLELDLQQLTPLSNLRPALRALAPSLASSPFVIPDESYLLKAHQVPSFTAQDQRSVTGAFDDVVGLQF